MTPNDTITTTTVRLNRRSDSQNPYRKGTSEWAAWEAGFAAARQSKGHPFNGR